MRRQIWTVTKPMASRFTHAICGKCWAARNNGIIPHQLVDAASVACCYCGNETTEGIYIREAPEKVPCGGSRIGGVHDGVE